MVAEMEMKLLMGKIKLQVKLYLCFSRTCDRAVNIAMGYGLNGRLLVPPSLIYNGNCGLFPQE
jgi:hypothetical protein